LAADRITEDRWGLDLLCANYLKLSETYDSLEPAAREVLTKLATLSVDEFVPSKVAVGLGLSTEESERLIERLVDVYLVDPVGPNGTTEMRYRLLRLARTYVRGQEDRSKTH
jgi:hypothetical protein